MGKITKNYLFNLIYQLFIMLVPLVTAPYLARVLGAEALGTYSYVHSVAYLVTTITLLGIYQYGNRQVAYVRDDPGKLSMVFWQVISTRIVLALFGTIAYVVVVLFVNRYLVLFLLYYTYVLAYFLDCTWLFVGVEDMKWAVIKNTITKVLAISGIFLLVKKPEDLLLYVLIQGLTVLISNLLAYTQIKRYVGSAHFDLSNFKCDIKASFLLFLPSVATTVYLQSDKIMIELMTGNTSHVSFYDYSEKIVTIPLTFITVLSTVMMPRIANEFANGHKEKISELLNSAAQLSLFLAFPMMFGLMGVADKLVPWYLGTEFLPTIVAIVVISPIIISNTMTALSGTQYFTATNQISILLKSQTFAVIANLIINAMLIPGYGYIGAAVATLICSFSSAVIQYAYLRKQIHLARFGFYIVKYLVMGGIMMLAIRAVTQNYPATPVTNIIQIIIGIAVYFALCIITKDQQMKRILNKVREIVLRRR